MTSKEKYYVNIGQAADLEDKKERLIYRLFEILPGFLVWTTLIATVFFSWLKPIWTAYFIISFSVYWLLRVSHFTLHLFFAYLELKKNLSENWENRLEELRKEDPNKDWRNIYHLVVFPMHKESLTIARSSFDALARSNYPKERMIVVLGTEERAGKAAQEISNEILSEYRDKFFKLIKSCHPGNIPGEIPGKGSNETWAARMAKEEIIDKIKIPYENIIVSAFDIDTQVYPDYFSCLTYKYLKADRPTRSSFQPVPVYFNNLWEAPFFSRVVSSCNVFWQMMQQQRPEKITTYSSHSMSFKALVEMGFWQVNVVSEDAGVFWKAFLFFDGEYEIVPIHYPLSMDSCVGENFWQTIINQYKQQRRWAWGSEGIPYLLFGFLKNKKISREKKIRYIFLMVESFWTWGTNALLILFLGWLPLTLGGRSFQGTLLSYNLPNTISDLMNLALISVLACITINNTLISFNFPKQKKIKFLGMVLQWVFLPFSLIFFGTIPSIDAQTRLMLGKRMGFWVTEKFRKK